MSVNDLSKEISALLAAESAEALDGFEGKLMNYGLIPELLQEPLIKFAADKNRAYSVTDKFPKIDPKNIRSEIISVKYSIDLSQCAEHEIELGSVTF